jgi:GTP-binding protein
MQIRSVEYRTSALKASGVPRQWIPHVAVAGRSNVGKSSLLNWLLRRSVARVAKAPGKTRTLNFFLINENLYLVDLPGYGYAKVGKKLQQEWGRELTRYLVEEPRLAGVVTLVDVRHGPTALDLQLQGLIAESGLERVVVLTKGDKLKRGQAPGNAVCRATAARAPHTAGGHERELRRGSQGCPGSFPTDSVFSAPPITTICPDRTIFMSHHRRSDGSI